MTNVFKVLYGMMSTKLDNTSIKKESPEKYSWWLNELESLGLSVKKANDLNDIRRYIELLVKTCNSVTEPFGYTITTTRLEQVPLYLQHQ